MSQRSKVEGTAQVTERRGYDRDYRDGEDGSDHAVERRRRQGGEEDPQGMHAHGPAHDLRHQDVPFELLGDQKETHDYKSLPEASGEKRDQDRRDSSEERSEDGDDLRNPDPQVPTRSAYLPMTKKAIAQPTTPMMAHSESCALMYLISASSDHVEQL